jgi:hypothetical protein
MKNLTYDQLIELAPKDRPFQILLDNNDIEWCWIEENELYTCFEATNSEYWKNSYKGTFTLIDPRYQKPEELELGAEVEILESARDIDEGFEQETYIEKIGKINIIQNDYRGLWYGIVFDDSNHWIGFPHYCVMPVGEEEVQEIPELENTLEQLDNLVSKAQDIISKYKK